MYTSREDFKGAINQADQMFSTSDDALRYCQYNQIMLDPSEMNPMELEILLGAQEFIKANLLKYRDNVPNNTFVATVINDILIPNLSVTKKEWWYFYGTDLKEVLPLVIMNKIQGRLITMYKDFFSLYNEKLFSVLDKLEAEENEQRENPLVTKIYSMEDFMKEMDRLGMNCPSILRRSSVDEDLAKIRSICLLPSKQYRNIKNNIILNGALSSINMALDIDYKNTTDEKKKDNLEKLSQKLKVDNLYWWHLYDDTYSEFISKPGLTTIHSLLITMYDGLYATNLKAEV